MFMATTMQGPGAPGQFEAQQLATDRTLRGLQAEARDVGRQLRAAVEHRQTVASQLSVATGGQVPALTAQLAEVDASIAGLQSRLASVATRIAQTQLANRSAHVDVPTFRWSNPTMNGREISIVAIAFTFAVLMPISVGIVLRLLRGPRHPAPPVADPVSSARLDRLEQSMDAIAIEIERISEGQRFVTKILTERPAHASPAPPPSIDASSMAESKPFLALGAGPMETIRTPERQGVRPSITPH